MREDPSFSLPNDSPSSLPAFLERWKPSVVSEADCEWIWVRTDKERSDLVVEQEVVVRAGKEILAATTRRVQEISGDSSIPSRAVKAQPGQPAPQTKRQLIEEVQADAIEEFKQLSISTGFTHGKLLIFQAGDKIDSVFSELATSLIKGSLSQTDVNCMKVAPRSSSGQANSHLICLYVPDVYQKEALTLVLQVLAKDHGIISGAVKSDLYTFIDLYSNHPSGLRASVWTAKELTDVEELESMRNAHWKARDSSDQPSSSTSTSNHNRVETKPSTSTPRFPGTGTRLDGGVAAPYIPPPPSRPSSTSASASSSSTAKPKPKSTSDARAMKRLADETFDDDPDSSSSSSSSSTKNKPKPSNSTARRGNGGIPIKSKRAAPVALKPKPKPKPAVAQPSSSKPTTQPNLGRPPSSKRLKPTSSSAPAVFDDDDDDSSTDASAEEGKTTKSWKGKQKEKMEMEKKEELSGSETEVEDEEEVVVVPPSKVVAKTVEEEEKSLTESE